MAEELQETQSESRFREYVNWAIVLGTALCATYFFGFLVYHSVAATSSSNNWFLKIIEEHYAATIGVPLSAICALCVVLLLKVANFGPIELEALGFKFRGASGPVVLWIFCFLAIVFGMYLLWGK